MSVPEAQSSSSNGNGSGNTSNILSQSNVVKIQKASRTSLDRFVHESASEGPYYIGARMADRSNHIDRLTNQCNAMNEILKRRTEA
ncbi:hypothetical protein N7495_006742 [Penicillium taxi]|uniref:uncharacterized protein n=1 Tax=Penicillium taxi TaxID=168475 RepID=UPI0025455900|nr:uncharacterized protein N7495_006742 [Penicillium taxi]KAJ5895051.1 hypothetical protein N7495_006742 [Penicillium taxi]